MKHYNLIKLKNSGKAHPALLIALIVLIFGALIGVSLVVKIPDETRTYAKIQMGTMVEITVAEDTPRKAVDAAFNEIDRLEALLSNYREESDATNISKNAGQKAGVRVSKETIQVLETALLVARWSSGAFDPTVGSLASLWGFSGEVVEPPTEDAVRKLLPFVNYRYISIDEEHLIVRVREGVSVNLGGVAKGYIVGRAIEVLKEHGVRRGIIKAGGDMTVFGGKRGGAWEESRGGASGSKDAKPFKVGIQHPRAKDKLLGTVTVFEGAVTTSGDYERFFIMGNDDNIRYHHILDPKTGFPVKGLMSVTIISKEAALADALSTAVFVMGPLKGMVFVESLPGVEAVIVDSLGVITLSSGAAGIFEEL